ncbi:MAG TPA: immunity 8 family protein [Puia sp.]|nr:immunity 8 family protein [Puia sp.]
MLSEVRSITSTEIIDLDTYRPIDLKSFSFLLTVSVGAKGTIGQDLFNIEVCTPQWLMDNHNQAEFVLGRRKLIVFEFDMQRILGKINSVFNGCYGKDWNEIAIKLSRIGYWEFEDYKA